MRQEISNAAVPTGGFQLRRLTRLLRSVPAATATAGGTSMSQLLTFRHPRTHSYRQVGWVLIAALVLGLLNTFTSASPANASADCWSYNTWSNKATHQDNGTPIMYWNDGSGPRLGLGLNSCGDYIKIKWSSDCSIEGCDPSTAYQIDWKRPGIDDWQKFTVPISGASREGPYLYHNFRNAHYGTYYNFAVARCDKYRCSDWSPTVGINT